MIVKSKRKDCCWLEQETILTKGITMSVFTPTKTFESKVHHSQYIRTANTPDEEDATPAEPATKPVEPETK